MMGFREKEGGGGIWWWDWEVGDINLLR